MSDEALLMMTGLWVAFCCAASEAALRRSSGVHDDGKADRSTDSLSRGPDGSGVHRHGLDHRSDAMTDKNNQEKDESRGQIIDFFDARCRRDWARYARDNGLRRTPDVRGK